MPLMGGDSQWRQNIAIIITLVCVIAAIFFVSYYSWHTSPGVVFSLSRYRQLAAYTDDLYNVSIYTRAGHVCEFLLKPGARFTKKS